MSSQNLYQGNFFGVWNILFGILDTKISRISGFLRADEGQ
jgi:hypothetical protein